MSNTPPASARSSRYCRRCCLISVRRYSYYRENGPRLNYILFRVNRFVRAYLLRNQFRRVQIYYSLVNSIYLNLCINMRHISNVSGLLGFHGLILCLYNFHFVRIVNVASSKIKCMARGIRCTPVATAIHRADVN